MDNGEHLTTLRTQPETTLQYRPAGSDTDSEGGETDVSSEEMPKAAGDAYLTPEMQYLAPEDYELPAPDPALLASANRMLSERLAGVAHALRGSGLACLRNIDDGGDLQPHVAALACAYQMAMAAPAMLRRELAKADAEMDEAAAALAQVIGDGSCIDTTDMSLGELVAEACNQLTRVPAELANATRTSPSLPTYAAGKHEVRVGSLLVGTPGTDIFDESITTVRINDEASGEFVEVEQITSCSAYKICITTEEWPAIRQAVDMMIAQCRNAA